MKPTVLRDAVQDRTRRHVVPLSEALMQYIEEIYREGR